MTTNEYVEIFAEYYSDLGNILTVSMKLGVNYRI
jgi:hypothetical protein